MCRGMLGRFSVSVFVQGPLIVTEELHSLSFESELQLNQSGLNIKLEVRPGAGASPSHERHTHLLRDLHDVFTVLAHILLYEN